MGPDLFGSVHHRQRRGDGRVYCLLPAAHPAVCVAGAAAWFLPVRAGFWRSCSVRLQQGQDCRHCGTSAALLPPASQVHILSGGGAPGTGLEVGCFIGCSHRLYLCSRSHRAVRGLRQWFDLGCELRRLISSCSNSGSVDPGCKAVSAASLVCGEGSTRGLWSTFALELRLSAVLLAGTHAASAAVAARASTPRVCQRYCRIHPHPHRCGGAPWPSSGPH
mmetsp:Transcript_7891/g.23251  ORF Transcript_7891/g.23251 Transcript_7891/m.23251 type:complete len:220 (+) Transcript_7891:2307-2966(+)